LHLALLSKRPLSVFKTSRTAKRKRNEGERTGGLEECTGQLLSLSICVMRGEERQALGEQRSNGKLASAAVESTSNINHKLVVLLESLEFIESAMMHKLKERKAVKVQPLLPNTRPSYLCS
jgi:hypothetical protein